jgi:hypothetical protein
MLNRFLSTIFQACDKGRGAVLLASVVDPDPKLDLNLTKNHLKS